MNLFFFFFKCFYDFFYSKKGSDSSPNFFYFGSIVFLLYMFSDVRTDEKLKNFLATSELVVVDKFWWILSVNSLVLYPGGRFILTDT
jgi:hypothetical protein